MKKVNVFKRFLRGQTAARLSYFERSLFIGLMCFADEEKISANPAYLRSTLFPFDDLTVDDVDSALKNLCETLGMTAVQEGEEKYFFPYSAVCKPKRKKEKQNEEKRKEPKEIKKKEKKGRKESINAYANHNGNFPFEKGGNNPLQENPCGRYPNRNQNSAAYSFYRNGKRYYENIHFENERKYTQEELDALITDVDDIEI